MSDSRGLERVFEQGALFYCLIGSCENADAAHKIESQLIGKGLRNSVTKRQKEKVLSKPFDKITEQKLFSQILDGLGQADKKMASNLAHFFFNDYPGKSIEPLGENPISGMIRGVVGRYLILENNGHLYGFWLSDLFGFKIEVNKELTEIESEPEQISLFS